MFAIEKKFIFFTLLLFVLPMLSNESKGPSQDSVSNVNQKALSEMEKEIEFIIKSAMKTHIGYDKELFEIIFRSAPQDLKDKIAVIEQIFKQKKNGEKNIQWNILPSRLLLVGPPGVGKSTLAQVVADRLERPFYFIRMPMLGNEFRNSEAANLNRLMSQLIKSDTPCVIILDEINIFAERKVGVLGEDNSAGSMLWLLLDKCATNPNVLVIGTANDVSKLPEQLKDRFEGNVIEIVKNDWHDRYFVLDYYLSKTEHFCTDKYLISLAKKTEEFSPRQLEALVKSAQQQRFIISGSIDFLSEKEIESAYKKMLLNSRVLKSKLKFDWKNWLKEHAAVIQSISSSLHVATIITGLGFATFIGVNSLIKNNFDMYL